MNTAMSSTAEQVMVSKLRETEALDHGKVRQIFDVTNCPGLTIVWEGFADGGEFETVSQRYELVSGATFDNAGDALLAWDSTQTDRETLDGLAHALLRYRFGLMRPLWEHRTDKDKFVWLANARTFRNLLHSLGMDIVRKEAP